MNSYLLHLWEHTFVMGPFVVNWKNDLPYVVVWLVGFLVPFGAYVRWKDNCMRRQGRIKSPNRE